jgi:hypothetical protein
MLSPHLTTGSRSWHLLLKSKSFACSRPYDHFICHDTKRGRRLRRFSQSDLVAILGACRRGALWIFMSAMGAVGPQDGTQSLPHLVTGDTLCRYERTLNVRKHRANQKSYPQFCVVSFCSKHERVIQPLHIFPSHLRHHACLLGSCSHDRVPILRMRCD